MRGIRDAFISGWGRQHHLFVGKFTGFAFILLIEADKNDDARMVKPEVWNNGGGILIYWLMMKVLNLEQ
jgi:hypothetical protein